MIDPWNDRRILPPPINTFYCSYYFDVDELKFVCDEIARILMKQSPLHEESAILSRFIYKFNKKFRNDIGFRKFKKVNTCLRRYLSLNFLKDLETFTSVIPTNREDLYLPTRQMLEYVLIRLITLAKIIFQTYVNVKLAAIFYLDRLKRGESHWMSFMPYALLSRIWSLVSVLLKHLTKWYATLYNYLSKLELKGIPFLHDGFQLPSSLQEYLDLKNVDNVGRLNWSVNKVIKVIPILNEIEDYADSFDLLKYVSDMNKQAIDDETLNKINNTNVEVMMNQPKYMDKGEIVSRESYLNLFDKIENKYETEELKEDKMNVANDHTVNHVTQIVNNLETLKYFLSTEESFRNDNDKRSLTSHLSFMQWQALKLNLNNLHNLKINDKKICKRFNKIWQEKCLDYL